MPSSGATATPAEVAKIKKLYDKGLSRNEIGRQMGRSWQWAGAVCKRNGWSFDRAATKAAAEANVFDAKARLSALAIRSIEAAEAIVARLEAENYEYTIAVAGKGAVKITDTNAPAQDLRNLTAAYGTFLTQATRLLDRNDDGGLRKEKSMVEKLADKLGIHDD